MKECKICGKIKPIDEFGINNALKDGHMSKCKKCMCDYYKKRAQLEHVKQYKKDYKKRPEVKERNNSLRNKLRENPEYRKLESIKSNERQKKLRNNPETRKLFLEKSNKIKNTIYLKKYHNDELFRSWEIFSSNFYSRIKKKNKNTLELVGYNKEDFFNQIGKHSIGFDLDHKIPVTWFTTYEPHLVYSLDNLQWLEQKINRTKNNRYSHSISVEYFNKIKNLLKKEYITRFVVIENIVYDIYSPEPRPPYQLGYGHEPAKIPLP
jgi:hypothetical protein